MHIKFDITDASFIPIWFFIAWDRMIMNGIYAILARDSKITITRFDIRE
jgi:hypothetical protein